MTFGIVFGTISGFMNRYVDSAIMSIVDVFLAFPGLLLAIAMVAVFGAGMWQVILAISISDIPRAIRLQRSMVLSIKTRPYIDAARMAHAPGWWLLVRHVIPSTMAPMLVVGSIAAANAILIEASLSFLGLDPVRAAGAVLGQHHQGRAAVPGDGLVGFDVPRPRDSHRLHWPAPRVGRRA